MTSARVPASCAAIALGILFAGARCSPRVVDAVDLGPAASGAGPGPAEAGTLATLTWPNETSTANSDPWLPAHHDALREMHPRLLLLDFYDGDPGSRPFGVDRVVSIAEQQINAVAQGSRYHAYADPTAPVFLQYDLVKTVDMTDPSPPATWTHPSSTLLPLDASGLFDTSALFTADFAPNYGFIDPADPTRSLTLCELFERGIINELWMAIGDGARMAPLFIESKQTYDAAGQAIPGAFQVHTGYVDYPANVPQCAVTVRIAHLDPRLELGCDLIVRSVGVENMRFAIPYLQTNALSFINHDFDRFGVGFSSWEDLCGAPQTMSNTPQTCVTYPATNVAEGTYPDGGAWRIAPFVQGCGTAHFPPNATFKWDYTNPQAVQSRCEHYGMRDGPNQTDLPDEYRSDKVTAYTQMYGNPDAGVGGGCGGGWQVYYRQNMPGLNNAAFAADGSPMKNWWPFLFY